MSRSLVALSVFGALAACAGRSPRPALVATGEASHFTRTGRYDEAIRLCRDFTRAYGRVRCDQLGTTGEGRPIIALHIGRGDRPAFERKEYMESYVAEQLARDMLAADPSLRAAFDAALAADPALASSPGRRLDWFYRRSPAWDERVNLLPIYRIQTSLAPARSTPATPAPRSR